MFVFFFNDTATTEIYTLSLHDALPISEPEKEDGEREPFDAAEISGDVGLRRRVDRLKEPLAECAVVDDRTIDRKSTRLNSSHANISYAVFCLKKKQNRILWLVHFAARL